MCNPRPFLLKKSFFLLTFFLGFWPSKIAPKNKINCVELPESFLGPAFGRTDFSRIFFFEPPDFFADFVAGFFLLIFVGKSAQKNPPGKSPGKSSRIYTTKILRHISAEIGRGKVSENDTIKFQDLAWQGPNSLHKNGCAFAPLRNRGSQKVGEPCLGGLETGRTRFSDSTVLNTALTRRRPRASSRWSISFFAVKKCGEVFGSFGGDKF